MLKLYIKDFSSDQESNYCRLNDPWFDKYSNKVKFSSKQVKNIMKRIDDAEYLGHYRMTSRFIPDVAIRIEELSTGCKTTLNILTFPDKLFTIAECGGNAMQEIFNLKQGNAYLPYFIIPRDFTNDIEVIYQNTSTIIHNNKELESLLCKIF